MNWPLAALAFPIFEFHRSSLAGSGQKTEKARWGLTGVLDGVRSSPARAEIPISKLGVRGLVIKPRAARGMALIKKNRAARESFLENG